MKWKNGIPLERKSHWQLPLQLIAKKRLEMFINKEMWFAKQDQSQFQSTVRIWKKVCTSIVPFVLCAGGLLGEKGQLLLRHVAWKLSFGHGHFQQLWILSRLKSASRTFVPNTNIKDPHLHNVQVNPVEWWGLNVPLPNRPLITTNHKNRLIHRNCPTRTPPPPHQNACTHKKSRSFETECLFKTEPPHQLNQTTLKTRVNETRDTQNPNWKPNRKLAQTERSS